MIVSHESACAGSGKYPAGLGPASVSPAFAARGPAERLKPTTQLAVAVGRCPVPLLLLVRDAGRLFPADRHRRSGLLDRRQDPGIGATTAEVPVHRRPNLLFGGTLGRREQVSGLDHHPVLAKTTMRHLQVDPRLLNRMQRRLRARDATLLHPQSRQTLERRDRLARNRGHRGHAATDLLAVEQHRARTTLRQTTAEPGPVQVQLVAHNVQERRVTARAHRMRYTVHLDRQLVCHSSRA